MSSINNNNGIPEELICPISLEIMTDPVICEDGYTYDRSSILALQNSVSPFTRQFIDKNNLRPNRAIKDAISRFNSLSSSSSNIFTRIISAILPTTVEDNSQLIIPNINITDITTRSPWNDKVYNIQYKEPVDHIDRRVPTTIIAVIDTSGSMGSACSAGTGSEDDGYDRLNILQHLINTMIETLKLNDELALIEFNSTATTIFNEKINNTNKSLAKTKVNSLYPNGGTQIWNGLKKAYEIALNSSNNNIQIMLLTDGEASDQPYLELRKYLEKMNNPKLNSINLTTFGFSYDINSRILFDIAEYTKSGFNFIPDVTMAGTSICNYLANIYSPDFSIPVITEISSSSSSSSLIDFNSLNSIQQYELVRFHCSQILKDACFKSQKNLTADIIDMINKFKNWISSEQNVLRSELLLNMLKDFVSDEQHEEQITKASSRKDWFSKWGFHYLLSLSSAHSIRKCHNYKDVGVSSYGNKIFKQLCDDIYDKFSNIKPPVPRRKEEAKVVRQNMSVYVDRSYGGGGCFSPFNKLKLSDGTFKELHLLTGNELVYQGENMKPCRIKYIVATKIPNGKVNMCNFNNGLTITPWHPMLDLEANSYVFPIDLIEPKINDLDYMYNIVLENGYWIEIEGVRCVSLGHGLTTFDKYNSILSHDYFGTDKVINDIEKFKVNSDDKIIKLENYNIIRDINTNLVCNIIKVLHPPLTLEDLN